MLDSGRLAGVAVRVAMLDGDDVIVFESRRGGDGQRQGLHGGLIQWSPDIDKAVAALEQSIGLVGVVAAYPLLNGLGCLVDVNAEDRAAVRVGDLAADGVVKDEDAFRAGNLVKEKLLYLWVVVGLDRVIVYEVGLLGRRHVLDNLEGVTIKAVFSLPAAQVVNEDIGGVIAVVSFENIANFIEREGAVSWWLKEVEACGDVASGNSRHNSHCG